MAFEVVDWSLGAGRVALSPLPSSDAEFGKVRDWAPDVVVSLTSPDEMGSALGRLQAGGWDWLHTEITDFGTPDAAFERDWPEMSAKLVARMQDGGRVLVHCRGGCGRSGMVVLALMLVAGDRPTDALRRLRARRPCAVETDAQLAWGMGQAPGNHG